ncbi:hypothetical protein SNE40_012747 [Patella caerulea]|uniref:Nibrin n=1 Tax=Patella caerulea TaxID=87958 RepID=A0AAN8JIA5_PATCE
MWYLISNLRSDERYVFLCGKEYVFGRKDCDVILTGDPAVSRRHATIQINHSDSSLAFPHKLPLVLLKDLSKFGTWLSGKRVQGEAHLKDGDQVYFGSPKSSFTLVYEPFIVTTSCLDTPSKKLSRTFISKIGGHLVNDWRKECNLLVMNSISVTIKVVCALVSQKCIVTPNYLEDYLKYLEKEGIEPDPKNYLPTVIESEINSDSVSFLPDVRRKTLFQGMKFIFLIPKQFKKMNMAIELAGGMPILMEEGSDDNDDSVLCQDGTVVMAITEDLNTLTPNAKQWCHQVQKILKKKKKNMIPDSEIGYAVLFCSTENHCNPDISNQQIIPEIKSQSLNTESMFDTTSDILAVNTEISQQGKTRKIKTVATPGGRQTVDETFISKESVKKGKSPVARTREKSPVPNRKGPTQSVADHDEPVVEIKDEPLTPMTTTSMNIAKDSSIYTEITEQIKTEPTSSRKRTRSPSPVANKKGQPNSTIDDDDLMMRSTNQNSPKKERIAVRKRGRSPSPSTSRDESANKRNKVIEAAICKQPTTTTIKKEEIAKEENITHVDDPVDVDQSEQTHNEEPSQLQDGFLTTRKHLQKQRVKNEDYIFESDLPERCVVTSFVELVTRPPTKTPLTRGEAVPQGYIKWKGQLVKNYKKFKKVQHAGSHALPNIIGGSDLQVHEVERSKDLENWFQQSMQAESQQNEQEKEAQELFDFQPKHSRKKTR